MNILLFVTTMIMILASLTYARLEMYRSFSVMQSQFNTYMQKTERSHTNQTAEWWYDNHKASNGKTKDNDKKKTPSVKVEGLSRLSFAIFLYPDKRQGHEKEFPMLQALAKKLIHLLYKDHLFYQTMEQKHPDFVDTLLAALEMHGRLPKEQQIKKVEDLGALSLNDKELNDVFTKMLKGTAVQEEKPKVKKEESLSPKPVEETAEDDDQEGEKDKKHEYRSPEGYYSLLDFITIKNAYKIRIYLAPKMLLGAIFDDPEIVKAIVESRTNLYKQVTAEAINPEEATKQFEGEFSQRSDPAFKEILDFSVTKTNPQKYE